MSWEAWDAVKEEWAAVKEEWRRSLRSGPLHAGTPRETPCVPKRRRGNSGFLYLLSDIVVVTGCIILDQYCWSTGMASLETVGFPQSLNYLSERPER